MKTKTRKEQCKKLMLEFFGKPSDDLVNYMTEESCIEICRKKVEAFIGKEEAKKFDSITAINNEKRNIQKDIMYYVKKKGHCYKSDISKDLEINYYSVNKHLVCLELLGKISSSFSDSKKQKWFIFNA
jgi:hypothetical protein